MRLSLIGPPACGKGTQAQRLSQRYGLPALSTGDMLRAERDAQTELGLKIGAIIDGGNLVSDPIILDLIETRIKHMDEGFILDGSPRSLVQAKMLHDLLDGMGSVFDVVFLIEVGLDDVLARMTTRRENMLARGEAPRADDQPDSLRHRYKIYESQTLPLTPFYEKKGQLVRIDGRQGIDETTQAMIAAIEKRG